jgi:hypothetical protein
MMKKFNNVEKIEGYVYSIGSNFNELQERVSGENSKNPGTKYIMGDLDIAVDEAGLNVVTVHYTYVTETYKNGNPNNTYGVLKKIIDNPEKYWINGGKEAAFKVQCTAVSIGINDFIGSDDKPVAAMRNEGGFCTLVKELCPENERNTFSVDMLITRVTRVEADPEKYIDKDFCSVGGCIFGYGPKLLPVSLVVKGDAGMKHFESLDASNSNPVFTKVWGHINCKTIKVEKKEESAFGEAAVQTYERKSREYEITGTAKVTYDFGDEEILTTEDVVKMNQDRQVLLAEIKKRHDERQAAKKSGGNGGAAIPAGEFNF